MDDVNWGVVNNGLDFLESSVDHLAKGTERDLKYAALHLFASMETLVKARLAREHWTLVTADAKIPSQASYRAGEARSVTITQALQRLEAVANVRYDEESIKRIRAVERLRNRAAHFSMRGETQKRVEVTVAQGLDFMLHFIETQLRPGAPQGEAELIDRTLEGGRQTLGSVQALVLERLRSLQEALHEYPFTLDCPACRQPCLVLAEGRSARCLYCLYDAEGPEIAEIYTIVILEIRREDYASGGVEWPVADCPDCSEEAFVPYIYSTDDREIGSACFACGLSRPD
ncbi:hypothetical protein [Dactylosporangium salmoneum]|uniref:DUF4145 domain-containing protein n=1 Tax=Dactylosporangium salmoneum TaxID=53361 RepID=A0ABP5T1A2_9ACTN